MEGKQTQGRKKIEMKMIKNENSRRITFSKRRTGLFKKASELSTLCGVEIAIIVFSLGGKAFSFGHPSVGTVINRFLSENHHPTEQTTRHLGTHREARLQDLNQQFNKLSKQLEVKKKKGKMLRKSTAESKCQSFEKYINGLGLHELEKLKGMMEKLKENVVRKVNELHSEAPPRDFKAVGLLNVWENGTDNDHPIPKDWLSL
ncbi:unnamed protein product [Ilex paraguariensis]|uniref:MADS-box domain-containing protein n=1 Tax=Ilex paraguariensis TaxID=185542 RepID=A0ABC8R363_9AQUA